MKILFVCKGNVGRSQMAGELFNALKSLDHNAKSAGYDVYNKEGEPVHDLVVSCMLEKGHNLSGCVRKQVTEALINESDKIIVMSNDGDILPEFLNNSPKTEFWNVEDPKNTTPEFHREVRDIVERLVKKLLNSLP